MSTHGSNRPLLEVRNLRIEFPTRRGTLVAVDDISHDQLGGVGEAEQTIHHRNRVLGDAKFGGNKA